VQGERLAQPMALLIREIRLIHPAVQHSRWARRDYGRSERVWSGENRRAARRDASAPWSVRSRASMAREPFTQEQLAYIEARALEALRVWGRALKHLDRIGASNHPLYRVVRAAHDADHALRVHAMYAKHEAENRGGRAGA
jgi:hypothetical protein